MSAPIKVKRRYRKKKLRKEGDIDIHGFRTLSDSSKIVEIMVKGGLDRQDINEKIADTISVTTKSGRDKNIPSLVSGLLTRLQDKGYQIEASWRLVPPKKVTKKKN